MDRYSNVVLILFGCVIFLASILLFSLVGKQDYEDIVRQQNEYCEMVKLYEKTNGEQGWPNYNKVKCEE